jgi:predicted nucleic acid-binding Zn ribbon protein
MDFAETTTTTTLARKRESLTKAFIADNACDRAASHNIVNCFTCGFSMVYKNNRFCSDRCRAYFDDGNPGYAQTWLRPKTDYNGIVGWRVVAGPPGLEVGSDYYNPFREAFKAREPRNMRATKNGFAINCAHCAAEFESRGLRCCSPKCEAELSKPVTKRKQRRPDIPYYSIRSTGHGYWQPKAALRGLGFRSVDCGFDSPEAWAKAERLNMDASEARKAA